MYNELMATNGGCALPCWWGFRPGAASLDEVRQLYASFEAYISEYQGDSGLSELNAIFVDPQIENGVQTRHMFLAQDGIMIEAEIEVVRSPSYQIEPILQRLGQPSEVWMWTIPEPYEGVLPARFRLYFPETGVLIGYGTKAVKADDDVAVCFEAPGSVVMLLWDPEIWDPAGDKGLAERASESIELTIEDHRPLEEVSNWDVEQFYAVLSDPADEECLRTPSNLWPPPA